MAEAPSVRIRIRSLGMRAAVPAQEGADFSYSVVIPTKNRPDRLDAALRLVSEQVVKPAKIVVVDASEPRVALRQETIDLLAAAGIEVEVLASPPSTARQRNVGIDAVTTPLVLCLDDDIVISPDYVARLIDHWRDVGFWAIGAISGYALPPPQSLIKRTFGRGLRVALMLHVDDLKSARTVVRRSGKLRYGMATAEPVVVPAIGAGACLFRTDLVRRHRFNTHFGGYVLGEDLDLTIRLSQEAPVIGTGERFEHHHATGGKHSPLRWYYRGRPETYFRLRNRHLTGLTYPAFWLSVVAESGSALYDSFRERNVQHFNYYARGVYESAVEVHSQRFSIHSKRYYDARAAYDRVRLSRLGPQPSAELTPGVRILGYHRVSRGDALCVPPETLRRQLEIALRRGAVPIGLTEAIDLLRTPAAIDKPYLAVTFDDGYRDNIEEGLPILEDLGFHATIFIVSAIADKREGFHWYRRDPPPAISWSDARELSDHPLLDFQAHGRSHRCLTSLSDKEVRDEIAGAKAEIERALGREVSTFCYPSGVFSEREARIVEESGYRAGVSSAVGVNQSGGDLYALRRLMISWSDDDRRFSHKLSGTVSETRLEGWMRKRRTLTKPLISLDGSIEP
jgi:peptidoglycan/xylan/chitin deacetylase (PgdA/CDA1 family)/glycosyltransferase involved in cell wall biosynthesis